MHSPFVKSAAQEQFRILVADDTPIMRSVFQSLPTTEILLRGVVTDRQALVNAVANSTGLDAVLCADHLSGAYGGVHALQQLRATEALPHETAFILMSGDARRSNLMVNVEARPDGILLKPFAPGILIKKLETVVHSRRALAPLYELARRQSWPELMRLATDMLARGTRYPAAVTKLKLEAVAHLSQPEAALSSYQAMLVATPNAPDVLLAAARLARQQGDFDEAERALMRILELQPANVFAGDMLVDVLLDQGNQVGAQHRLQQTIRQAPNSIERQRILGHLALLNGDTMTAQRAYLAAMRLQADAHGLADVDVVNAVRVLLLHGANNQAWDTVAEARKALPDSLMLDVMERFVEAVTYRQFDAFSKTQQRIADAVELLARPILKQEGALVLAAVEACLMSLLVHRAFALSKELVNTQADLKLHSAQQRWARKLHKWSLDVPDDELPAGMHHYHKFMK